MAEKQKTQEEFLDEIIEFVKSLPEGDRQSFACNSTFQITLWAGDNHLEMMGILECAKADILQYVVYPNNEDDDGDEWKKLINNN
jgi:hypothetical protein